MLRVYYASVGSLDISNLSALPEHRRAKIAALGRDCDKRRSLGAWLVLSYAFGTLGLKADGEWAVDGCGKPYFVGSDVHFSLSHSGDYAAICVSDSPCGVDIERIGRYRDAIIKRYFTSDEADYVSGDGVRFTEIWTRKEAVVKARGTGITEIGSFSALGDVHPYTLTTFIEPSGYVISAAGNTDATLNEIIL